MRKLLLNGFICIIILTLSMCGCGKTKVHEFAKSEKGVVFSAYSAPPVKGLTTEECDDLYKKLSEAGFTKAAPLLDGFSVEKGADVYETIEKRSVEAEREALIALDSCQKYGVKYWVRDWSFYGLACNYEELTKKDQYETVISKMFSSENKYINHPAYGGNFGHDEPSVQDMEKIVWQTELYKKYISKNSNVGGEIYLNLNPAYVADNSTVLSINKDYTYRQYVDYYFDEIAPLVGYVSWDFYPFKVSSNGENYVRDNYYYNLELMAQKCKETKYELRCFVQAKGDFTGIRPLETISDLRFQIYSNMAFGAREINYYTYSSSVDETNATSNNGYSLYNYKNGKYTWVYDAAKQVNNEIHAMEDAYMAYDWDGTMYKNADEMLDNQLFANLTSALDSHERMKIISCTQDVMAGTFVAKDKKSVAKDAFMLVNSTEPSEQLESEVKLQFYNASSLLMYHYGEKIVVPLNKDGSYIFKLQPGEGRFIIPLK